MSRIFLPILYCTYFFFFFTVCYDLGKIVVYLSDCGMIMKVIMAWMKNCRIFKDCA